MAETRGECRSRGTHGSIQGLESLPSKRSDSILPSYRGQPTGINTSSGVSRNTYSSLVAYTATSFRVYVRPNLGEAKVPSNESDGVACGELAVPRGHAIL